MCLTVIFCADTVANALTGDVKEDPKRIALGYLKGWGVPDIISCIPWDRAACGAGARAWLTCGRPLRLLRLLRARRLASLRSVCERLEMVFQWWEAAWDYSEVRSRLC